MWEKVATLIIALFWTNVHLFIRQEFWSYKICSCYRNFIHVQELLFRFLKFCLCDGYFRYGYWQSFSSSDRKFWFVMNFSCERKLIIIIGIVHHVTRIIFCGRNCLTVKGNNLFQTLVTEKCKIDSKKFYFASSQWKSAVILKDNESF